MPTLLRDALYETATAFLDNHIFKSLHGPPPHAPAAHSSSGVRPASPPACTQSDVRVSSSLCSDGCKSSYCGGEFIRLLLGAILAVSVILVSFAVPITRLCLGHAPTARGTLSLATLVAWSCATLAVMLGMPLYESAWRSFRRASSANVDSLVVVSATLSYAYSCAIATTAMLDGSDARLAVDSYFETSAILIPLVLLARFFESRTLQMTRTAMPASTGSLMAFASTDDSLNATGSGSDTGVELLQSNHPTRVSQSQQADARAQRVTPPRITDRASAVYVSCVLTGAGLVFALRLALSVTGAVTLPEGERSSLLYSLRCAIVLLISSCPCAICLAAPTAIMVGTAVGARVGVLFRDRAAIERLQCVSDIVFDASVFSAVDQPPVAVSADSLRPQAAQARPHQPHKPHILALVYGVIEWLIQTAGVRVWLVSGDSAAASFALADRLGVPQCNVRAEATPCDKVDLVSALQSRHQTATGRSALEANASPAMVAFVGDSANESAAALAIADIGMLMAANPNQIAPPTAADVVPTSPSLSNVAVAIDLSRTIYARIWSNFAWGLIYNAIAFVFSSGILLPTSVALSISPTAAGLAELLSCIPVTCTSLWLYFYRAPLVSGCE